MPNLVPIIINKNMCMQPTYLTKDAWLKITITHNGPLEYKTKTPKMVLMKICRPTDFVELV